MTDITGFTLTDCGTINVNMNNYAIDTLVHTEADKHNMIHGVEYDPRYQFF